MFAQNDAISRTKMSPSECRACADICATLADFAKTEQERHGFDALANLWEYLAQEMAAMSPNNWLALLAITTEIDRAMRRSPTPSAGVVPHVPCAPQGIRPRQMALQAG